MTLHVFSQACNQTNCSEGVITARPNSIPTRAVTKGCVTIVTIVVLILSIWRTMRIITSSTQMS